MRHRVLSGEVRLFSVGLKAECSLIAKLILLRGLLLFKVKVLVGVPVSMDVDVACAGGVEDGDVSVELWLNFDS